MEAEVSHLTSAIAELEEQVSNFPRVEKRKKDGSFFKFIFTLFFARSSADVQCHATVHRAFIAHWTQYIMMST
jgi:hypothetical protein